MSEPICLGALTVRNWWVFALVGVGISTVVKGVLELILAAWKEWRP